MTKESVAFMKAFTLSDNQELFVSKAEEQGFSVDMNYSGTGMFGKMCPAIFVTNESEFVTKASYHIEPSGKGFILYARN